MPELKKKKYFKEKVLILVISSHLNICEGCFYKREKSSLI